MQRDLVFLGLGNLDYLRATDRIVEMRPEVSRGLDLTYQNPDPSLVPGT